MVSFLTLVHAPISWSIDVRRSILFAISDTFDPGWTKVGQYLTLLILVHAPLAGRLTSEDRFCLQYLTLLILVGFLQEHAEMYAEIFLYNNLKFFITPAPKCFNVEIVYFGRKTTLTCENA